MGEKKRRETESNISTDEQKYELELEKHCINEIPRLETEYNVYPFDLSGVLFANQFFGQNEKYYTKNGEKPTHEKILAKYYLLCFNKLLLKKYGNKKAIDEMVDKIEDIIRDILSNANHLQEYYQEIRTFILSSLAYMYLAEKHWKIESFEIKDKIKQQKMRAEKKAKLIWKDLFLKIHKEKSYIRKLDLLIRYIKGSEHSIRPIVDKLICEAFHLRYEDPFVSTDKYDTHKIFREKERFLIHALKANTKLSEYKILKYVKIFEKILDLQCLYDGDTHERIRTRYNLTKKKLGILTP